jgi:hypothetical protein
MLLEITSQGDTQSAFMFVTCHVNGPPIACGVCGVWCIGYVKRNIGCVEQLQGCTFIWY